MIEIETADESAHLLPRDVIVTSDERQPSCMPTVAAAAGSEVTAESHASLSLTQTTDAPSCLRQSPARSTRRSLSNGTRRLTSDEDEAAALSDSRLTDADHTSLLQDPRKASTTAGYGTLNPAHAHRETRNSLQRLRQLSFTEVHRIERSSVISLPRAAEHFESAMVMHQTKRLKVSGICFSVDTGRAEASWVEMIGVESYNPTSSCKISDRRNLCAPFFNVSQNGFSSSKFLFSEKKHFRKRGKFSDVYGNQLLLPSLCDDAILDTEGTSHCGFCHIFSQLNRF